MFGFKKKLKATPKPISTNCDGCPKQSVCEYGYVARDLDGKTMTLWDKYIHLMVDGVVPDEKNPLRENKRRTELGNRLHKKRKFNSDDVEWLTEYFELEKSLYDHVRHFGQCGVVYARRDRLKELLQNIEIPLNKAKEAAQ